MGIQHNICIIVICLISISHIALFLEKTSFDSASVIYKNQQILEFIYKTIYRRTHKISIDRHMDQVYIFIHMYNIIYTYI